MKRHAALIRLSQEHHQGLTLALKLKRGGSDIADWDREMQQLEQHFTAEEQQFAPLWAGVSDAALQQRFVDEHRQLREYMQKRPVDLSAAEAAAFGQLLHDHIRFEERELFAVLEMLLD